MLSVLRKVRRNTYVDWAARDLIIKCVIQLYKSGASIREINEFKEYMLRKIREDIEHTVILLRVARWFQRAGYKIVFTDLRNESFDLEAIGRTRKFYIEVKGKPPPWGGNNFREYISYEELSLSNVLFVWEEKNDLYVTPLTFTEMKMDNKGALIVPTKKLRLRDFLQGVKE